MPRRILALCIVLTACSGALGPGVHVDDSATTTATSVDSPTTSDDSPTTSGEPSTTTTGGPGMGDPVVINELESGDDAIELFNGGSDPVDLSGWILTDDAVDDLYDPASDAEKFVFPPQTTLAPAQFIVVAKGAAPGQHTFGLGGAGDTVTLLRPDLAVVDSVTYGADEAAVSYCRLPDGPGGAWTSGCVASLGAANQPP